jgi:AcrR family transcriptional regulator
MGTRVEVDVNIVNMSGDRSYHHGNLRRALLDEGLQLLAEVGPHTFSLNALARRVGVSVAAPYRHFADRNSLLDAIADEGYELFHDALKGAISGAADEGDAIARIGLAYLDFAAQHKPQFGIMFRDREGRPNDVGAASFHTFAGAVVAAQAAGYLDPHADPRSLGRSIWSILHGAAVLDAYGGFSKLGLEIDRTPLAQELIGPFIRDPKADGS